MLYGVVKYYNKLKGYGFIELNQSAQVVFFHINNVIGTIAIGDTVKLKVQGKHFKKTLKVQKTVFH